DYGHVNVLADAHIAALDYMKAGGTTETVFNVGTGTGASVKEGIDTIAEVTGRDIVPEMGERRAGDPPALVADVSRIQALLSWKADFGLEDIVRSAAEAAGMLPGQERGVRRSRSTQRFAGSGHAPRRGRSCRPGRGWRCISSP